MATSCRYEFQLQHLRLESADESQFYEFQWTKKKLFFVLYRAFTFAYHWGWMIAGWVLAEEDNWYTLSNWSFFFTGLYFLSAFITALYGIIARNDYTASSNTDSQDNQPEVTNSVAGTASESGKLRFFHKITWLLHINSTVAVMFVTIIYWALLAHLQTETKRRLPIGQHKHSVQGVLLLIDILLIATPTRWLHFIYSFPYGFSYSIFTIIVYFAGVESSIYGFLNYEENVGVSVGVLIISTFVAPIIVHTVWFALYHLRVFIYRQTVGKESKKVSSVKFDTAHDNVAFTP